MRRDVDGLVRYLGADIGITKGGYLVKNAVPGQGTGIRQDGKLYAPGLEEGGGEDLMIGMIGDTKRPIIILPLALPDVVIAWEVELSTTIMQAAWEFFENWSAYSGYSSEPEDFLTLNSCLMMTPYFFYFASPTFWIHSFKTTDEAYHESAYTATKVSGITTLYASSPIARRAFSYPPEGATVYTQSQLKNRPDLVISTATIPLQQPYRFPLVADAGWNGLTGEWLDPIVTENSGEIITTVTDFEPQVHCASALGSEWLMHEYIDTVGGVDYYAYGAYPGIFDRGNEEGHSLDGKYLIYNTYEVCNITTPGYSGPASEQPEGGIPLSAIETGYEDTYLACRYHWGWTRADEGETTVLTCVLTRDETPINTLRARITIDGASIDVEMPSPASGDTLTEVRLTYPSTSYITYTGYINTEYPDYAWITGFSIRTTWTETISARYVGAAIVAPVLLLSK